MWAKTDAPWFFVLARQGKGWYAGGIVIGS
jgi:hypothetical protein